MDQTPIFNKTRTVLALTALLTALPVSLAGGEKGASYGGYYSGQSDISSRAQVRLQAKTEAAIATLEKGRALYKDGEYDKALEAFKAGLNELPNSPSTADRRAYAQSLVNTGTIAVAQQYRKTGRYEDATKLLQDILAADPTNRAARQELAYVNDPIRSNPALTPTHVENVKEVNKGLQKAFGYYELGDYDKADSEFNSILRIDPYNTAARRGMEKVANARASYYESARDQTRGSMLNQVNAAWETPVPMDAPKVGGTDGPDSGPMSPSTKNLMKLKNIIIPVVNFENTTLEEAIDFLRQRSRQYDTDPGEKGINFMIRGNSGGGAAAAPAGDELSLEDTTGLEAPAAAQPSGSVVISELKLRNVPMLEVLKSITDNAGMRYKIEDYAVSILPSGKDDTDMFSRTFTVPPNFYSSLQSSSGDAGGGGAADDPFSTGGAATSGIKPREAVDVLLKKIGVAFPTGATATFMPSSSSLIARNTPSNLDIIEQYIENLVGSSPKQVKIMTKFVEVSQDNTEELSFDWVVSPIKVGGADRYIGGGTPGNGTPGRNPGDFVGAPAGTNQWVDGISGNPTSEVKNLVTGGNRTGSGAINGDSINSVINNPNRSSSRDAPAPGIMSFTGIFDQGSMQMIMRGLSQKKGTDVMTAPSVTAKSAEKAKIEVVREFIYPTDYTEPQLPSSTGSNDNGNNNGWPGIGGGGSQASINAFPVTPSTPTGFTTRPVGVTLEIEPNITDGQFVIDFRFVPEIVEFDGFINYGSPISTAGIDADGNPATVVITENRIEMPVFSTRKVETNLYVYDGHTVSIGGLMQESVQTVEDSVPILGDLPFVGRLFRGEASNHIKTNLIIFVTADIIDATGRPVRNRQTEMGATGTPEAVSVSEEGLLPTM